MEIIYVWRRNKSIFSTHIYLFYWLYVIFDLGAGANINFPFLFSNSRPFFTHENGESILDRTTNHAKIETTSSIEYGNITIPKKITPQSTTEQCNSCIYENWRIYWNTRKEILWIRRRKNEKEWENRFQLTHYIRRDTQNNKSPESSVRLIKSS